MKKSRVWYIDLVVLIILGVFASFLSLKLEANFLASAFLFLGVPSVYLIIRGDMKKKEALTAALIFGGLWCFLLDYMAELSGAWAWQDETLLFSYKIFGVVTPDAIIWTFLWVLYLVLFYEHMLEHDRRDKVSSRVRYTLIFGLSVLMVVILLHYLRPETLRFTFGYFVLGLCTLPPLIYTLYRKPKLLIKFLKAAAFFVPLYLAYEITGLALGQWDFPGMYIGTIDIQGLVLPIEEFLFWIVLSSVVVLSYYELYIDDMR